MVALGGCPWKEAARRRMQDTTGSEDGSQAVSERRWDGFTEAVLEPSSWLYSRTSEGS